MIKIVKKMMIKIIKKLMINIIKKMMINIIKKLMIKICLIRVTLISKFRFSTSQFKSKCFFEDLEGDR